MFFRVTADCRPLRPTVVFSPLWLATLRKGTRPPDSSETYCGFPCVACHPPKGTQTLDRLHSGLGPVTYLLRGSGGYPQPPEALDFAPFGPVQLSFGPVMSPWNLQVVLRTPPPFTDLDLKRAEKGVFFLKGFSSKELFFFLEFQAG